MGNSVTRAHTRRRTALAAAIEAVSERWPGGPSAHAAQLLEDELAARGLCITDIGGQQVDDDTAHRTAGP